MTLIIAAGNSDQFIQVSDRRLTFNGILKDDESNKAIVFNCSNARLSVGFTGLARAGSFCTRDWILATLNKSAPPDYIADKIIKRFTEATTIEFANNQRLKTLSKTNKRLSIMFTGYLYHHEPPLGALCVVSNFQNLDTNFKSLDAADEFSIFFREEKRPNDGNITLFHSVGTLPPYPKKYFDEISKLVSTRRPSKAIVDKLVEFIRIVSEYPASGNTIGKQINSIVIPRDHNQSVSSNYHSDIMKMETYLPDQVMVISDKLHMNVSNISVVPVDENKALALSGPKLKPKQPCWCGSGKKFKICHGKAPNRNQNITLKFTPGT